MVMTPVGGLVGAGVPPLAATAGSAGLAMGALAAALLVVAMLVIVLARRGPRS